MVRSSRELEKRLTPMVKNPILTVRNISKDEELQHNQQQGADNGSAGDS
jgi:hypothetical protein